MVRLLQTTGTLLAALSVLTLLATIAILPWMLGGVIPLARFTLLAGAATACVLSVFANLFRWQLSGSLPAVLIPLLGLAILGFVQLQPDELAVANVFHHTQLSPPELPPVSHSLLPADTRTMVATLVALSLVSIAAFDRLRHPLAIGTAAVLLTVNAVTLTAVGMVQTFQHSGLGLMDQWTLKDRIPFGAFVNPNNAAGWLCLAASLATACLAWTFRSDSYAAADYRSLQHRTRDLSSLTATFANISAIQISAMLLVAFLATGVFATASRGGILAVVLAGLAGIGIRSSVRSLPWLAALFLLVSGGIYLMLDSFGLDETVATEMNTLTDLPQAAGSRPQHWLDSLQAMLDFPWLGTGLGTYRVANPPYQTVYSAAWYRNADNQFVEMFVEGGITGGLFFVGIGLCGLLTMRAAMRLNSDDTDFDFEPDHGAQIPRHVLQQVLPAALLMIFVSQAVSGFFDYGVAMPPAGALHILLIAGAAGLLTNSERHHAVPTGVAFASGRLIALLVQLSLVAGAGMFARDLWAAAEIDRCVVQVHQALAMPVSPEQLAEVGPIRRQLEAALKQRPDDPEGLDALRQIAAADFRKKVIESAFGPAALAEPGISNLWQRTTLAGIAEQLLLAEKRDKTEAAAFRTELLQLVDECRLLQVHQNIHQLYPLLPKTADGLAELALLRGDSEEFHRRVDQALFVEPSNAQLLFHFGLQNVHLGNRDRADELWQRCLHYSATYRPQMLAAGSELWSQDELLQKFGPRNYADAVTAARQTGNTDLRNTLWSRADDFWDDSRSHDEATAVLRAHHLLQTDRRGEAIEWLTAFVRGANAHLEARRLLADLLQKDGRGRDALQEWYRVLYFAPDDPQAQRAIDGLLAEK